MKVRMSLTLSEDLFEKIDLLRGREKRSTFVEYLLINSLSQAPTNETGTISHSSNEKVIV
jgi:metal-responsive CopG/Arc/MetJ family transcriptional regulator